MSLLTSLFIFLASPLAAEELAQAKMFQDLNFIQSTFETSYAPAEWKKELYGWSIEEEVEKSKWEIASKNYKTNKEYNQIVKKLFFSSHDYHTRVLFYSTESAYLPFFVTGAEGRYFISYIDRMELPLSQFGFKEGDELIEFDGKPVADVIEYIVKNELSNVTPLTDRMFAEMLLTSRSGGEGETVPKGEIKITVKSKTSGRVSTHTVNWIYNDEEIVPPMYVSHQKGNKKHTKKMTERQIIKKSMLMPLYTSLKTNPHQYGAKKSFLPRFGKKIWESPESAEFDAYIFEGPNHKTIGYIRIPHYSSLGETTTEFKEIIELFESQTDALLIDQLNNPGGIVFHFYSLLKHLAKEPLVIPKQKMMLNEGELMEAVMTVKELEIIENVEEVLDLIGIDIFGYPVNSELVGQLLNYSKNIITEWHAGRTFTQPISLFGIDKITPAEVHYTKPILVLINPLDGSCGDLFPLILQENKRATILGLKTAGAGGTVDRFSYPNRVGIASFSLTTSLLMKQNGEPLENNGCIPDIEVPFTANDIQFGYKDYSKKVLDALNDMLK